MIKTPLIADLIVKINHDVCQFAELHSLSQRELDVFILLINKITTSNEISKRLNLSPNTVSNHLKNILQKTNNHSKTELLASYIQFCHQRYEARGVFSKKPRVLNCIDSALHRNHIAKELFSRGIHVESVPTKDQVRHQIAQERWDSIVTSPSLEGQDMREILEGIRIFNKKTPAFFVVGEPEQTQGFVESGATEVLTPEFQIDALAFAIVENFIDHPFIRNRFLRVNTQLDVVVNQQFSLKTSNIGYGGLFVNFSEGLLAKQSFDAGHEIELNFHLPDSVSPTQIASRAKVCWLRRRATTYHAPGMGVQFIDLSQPDSLRVRDFVRTSKRFHLDHFEG